MGRMRWILLLGAMAVGIAVGVLGSCAIDDEVTWINDQRCTGGCLAGSAAEFSCDVDDSCTETSGCTDWDCADDGVAPTPDAGLEADATREISDSWSDGDPSSDVVDPGADADSDTEDDGSGLTCTPSGGGETREAAFELTLGVALADLTACPAPSRWFRFTIASGTRFDVDLVPAPERLVEFLLYAEDGSVVAAADMAADGDFSASAGTAGVYLLRVRALGDGPVGYSLAVRELP